tara:strand:- start:4983 stop:6620 length:1638 start_codon:yes stop_codon:yes gene_type:complete
MEGMMMNMPLRISSILEFAKTSYPEVEIISKMSSGEIHRTNYSNISTRSKKMANALLGLKVSLGDRVATIAWNSFRHFELYFAISGIGAVCHTINPRLSSEQLVYIINHAEDKVIFLDLSFIKLVEDHLDQISPNIKFVLMCEPSEVPDSNLPNVMCYEDLINSNSEDLVWPVFSEDTASGLCYTSGTTGKPKGVLYSNRSTVLHALLASVTLPDSFAVGRKILPIVPLFHANAWGIPYSAPLTGSSLVFPGQSLDGKSIYQLLDQFEVFSAWGVPTVWFGLLDEIKHKGVKPKGLGEMIVGGSAAPRSLISDFEKMGVTVVHAWGMTETSPLASTGRLTIPYTDLPEDRKIDLKMKQGRKVFGVDLKIVDDEGNELPQDGKNVGNLFVRGNTIAKGYFNNEDASKAAIDRDGWFETGDVASIDSEGFLTLTDRSKDLIKSGGEWISSIDLENCIMNHPEVENCAVIAVPHEKWYERPLLIVVPKAGYMPKSKNLLKYLEGSFAKWQMPDGVVYEEELPLTATGKVSKLSLRKKYGEFNFKKEKN